MAQTIYVYLTSNEVATIEECTGNPTLVTETVQDGFYRDIFTGTSAANIFFAGLSGVAPGNSKSLAAPTFVNGGIVPVGDPTNSYTTNTQLSDDTKSEVKVDEFKVTVSDEYAHEPLRPQIYPITYWAFPTTKNGTTMNMRFRTTLVKGWGNSRTGF